MTNKGFKDTLIKFHNAHPERGLTIEIDGSTIEIPVSQINPFLNGESAYLDLAVQNLLIAMSLAGIDLDSSDNDIRDFLATRTVKLYR